MAEWAAVDSRDYILALELGSAGECPPDFELPPSLDGFEAGVFLPRDDPDWFGRSDYPPRVLLLKDSALHIVSHPSAGEPPRRYAIDQICAVESGHMLLKGWLRITGSGFDYTVRYNTRGFPAVHRFLRSLRDRLLGGVQTAEAPAIQPDAGLDIKFGNALATELDAGERVRAQVFQPPREMKSRFWLLPYRRWTAGDLLALTGRRLLWITDRDRGSRSPYGTVALYAPLDAVRSVARDGDTLRVDLKGGAVWQVPVAPTAQTSLLYRCAAERT